MGSEADADALERARLEAAREIEGGLNKDADKNKTLKKMSKKPAASATSSAPSKATPARPVATKKPAASMFKVKKGGPATKK